MTGSYCLLELRQDCNAILRALENLCLPLVDAKLYDISELLSVERVDDLQKENERA